MQIQSVTTGWFNAVGSWLYSILLVADSFKLA